MPDDFGGYKLSILTATMRKLTEIQEKRGTTPTLRDADRIVAALFAKYNLDPIYVHSVAQAAIRNWRAANRARELAMSNPDATIRSAFLRGAGGIDRFGVLVVVHLEGVAPGQRNTMSVLRNVGPGVTLQQIIDSTIALVNSGEIKTQHGSPGNAIAVSAEIVQVVAGGYSQAQAPFLASSVG